ncbi:rna-directed dna polymerase from mobile element jockey-like [Pitangus sulphuratus]|nr:rna-directed dna polymerase from mobile element jockey-like [Pitangus sulphuratus]
MRLNKAKCKILHLGWSNPKYKCRLDGKWTESSPEVKDLRVLVEKELSMSQQCVLRAQKANCCTLGSSKEISPAGEGGDSPALLHSHETPPGVLHPALVFPRKEGCGLVGASPEEGHKEDLRAGAPLL